MIKKTIPVSFAIICIILITGCTRFTEKLETRSVSVGENKCTVQLMPSEFQEGSPGGDFDYFRIMIESDSDLSNSTGSMQANFGMDDKFVRIMNSDTLYPAFVQRIANGRKDNYEYIVSFEKAARAGNFEIFLNDDVFGLGPVIIKF